MSNLVVVAYDNEHKADEVLIELVKLQKEHLVDLEDAAIVVRRQDGKVKIKQAHNLMAEGAVSGGIWGLLIGVLFMNPLAGIVIGAAAGATGGALADIGINDDFIKDLGQTIDTGTSALFVLIRQATPDKVLADLKKFGGKVLKTSLTESDEQKLREALEGKKE